MIALAMLTLACLVAALVGVLDGPAQTVRLARLDAAASALGILAGAALAVRWRVDGAAPAWWAGMGVLTVSIPGIATNTGSSAFTAVYVACALTALTCFVLAIGSPAVDTTIRPVLGPLGATVVVLVLSGAADAVLAGDGNPLLHLAIAAAFVAAAGAASARRRAEPERAGAPLVALLVGLAGAAGVAALAPAGSVVQVGGPAMLRLVTFAVSAVGALAELHAASAVQRDAAYRSRLEREASEAERRTIEARFAERMHEVRSTIAAMAGSVRNLGADPSQEHDGPPAALAGALSSEIERLRRLVAADQERAADDAGTFDLRSTLEPMLTVGRAGGWPVSWELPAGLDAMGNPADVAQIVHGLLANATRYAPGTPIEVGAAHDGGFVVVTVDDRGPGVPRGARELVFERGRRAAEPADPSARGLGLYIARRLARAGGGDLWVESRPGGGARFAVAIPAVEPDGGYGAGAGTPAPVAHLRRAFRPRTVGRGGPPPGSERSA